MSFWIWVGIAIVAVLVLATVMDRRRRGWFMGYSKSSREDRILGEEKWGGNDRGNPPSLG